MKRFLFVLLLACFTPVFADSITLAAEDWARPRSGEALTRQPALVSTIEAFERQSDGVIVIGHSTNEEGQLWAEDLRSWLVALGVSSARIKFESRIELQGVLMLEVRTQESL